MEYIRPYGDWANAKFERPLYLLCLGFICVRQPPHPTKTTRYQKYPRYIAICFIDYPLVAPNLQPIQVHFTIGLFSQGFQASRVALGKASTPPNSPLPHLRYHYHHDAGLSPSASRVLHSMPALASLSSYFEATHRPCSPTRCPILDTSGNPWDIPSMGRMCRILRLCFNLEQLFHIRLWRVTSVMSAVTAHVRVNLGLIMLQAPESLA